VYGHSLDERQQKRCTSSSRSEAAVVLRPGVKVVLRVKIEMSSKRASVNPLAGFLKPQYPAERLAAQQRDREKPQREMQLKELQEEEALAAATASASATALASATVSAITNSSSSEQAALTGGLSNSKINSRQGPPEVPSNSKINPQTFSRTKIVI